MQDFAGLRTGKVTLSYWMLQNIGQNVQEIDAAKSCFTCVNVNGTADVIMHWTKAKQGTKESSASWTKGLNNRMLLFVLHRT